MTAAIASRSRRAHPDRAKAKAAPFLERTTFRTSRLLDFCSAKELIETKLAAQGVGKVMPAPDLLATAYRRATQVALLNRALDAAAEAASTTAAAIELPDDLAAQVQGHLQEHPQAPWDAAVADLANRALDDEQGSAP